MSKTDHVLLAHYDNDALSSWRNALEADGFKVQATSSGTDVVRRIGTHRPDVIVLDVLLPRMNGLAVLNKLKEHAETAELPVVMVLDEGDTYTENRAIICGADAILKKTPDGTLSEETLVAKIRSILAEQALGATTQSDPPEDTAELDRLLSSAAENLKAENPIVAHITDSLTGLFNADYLMIKLSEEFKRARRFALPLTTVMIGLRVGPQDEKPEIDSDWRRVLNETAGLLLCECRDIDVLARHNDDTFCLLLPNTDIQGAKAMSDRVLENIQTRAFKVGEELVTASAGATSYTEQEVEAAEELTHRAAHALRQAWRTGGNCCVVWAAEDSDST